MDGLLITVLAGVVAAVIGAVAAYYFGGLREKQKQAYDRQREQQRELDETRKQENERRARAFAEIRDRAHSVIEALERYTEGATKLSEIAEEWPTDSNYDFYAVPQHYKRRYQYQLWSAEQARDITDKMSSLRTYYQTQRTSLDSKSRAAFESFDKAWTKWSASLPADFDNTSNPDTQRLIDEEISRFSKLSDERQEVVSTNIWKLIRGRQEKRSLAAEKQELLNAVREHERNLDSFRSRGLADLGAHLDAIDAEAVRLSGIARR